MLVNKPISFNNPSATKALSAPIPNASRDKVRRRGVAVKSPRPFKSFFTEVNLCDATADYYIVLRCLCDAAVVLGASLRAPERGLKLATTDLSAGLRP